MTFCALPRISRVSSFFANVFALLCVLSSGAFAQVPNVAQSGGVTILHGGAVRGIVKNPNAGSGDVFEIEPTLGGKLLIEVEQVKQTTSLRPEQISYRTFAPLQKNDVESQLKIARWANTKKLSGIADEHFLRVVELDPENEEARKALQHVKVNGVWVSNKERLEQSGLERVGGRNVSKQEAEVYRQREEAEKETRFWRKEIKFLYQGATNENQRAREALRRVRNSRALSPLIALYKSTSKDAEGRVLLTQAISSIGTPGALAELGKIALQDPDLDVRDAAINGIKRKTTARTEAIEYFRRQLRGSNDVATINRAAYALGKLEAQAAIPDLINALVTSHKRQVVVGSEQTGATFDSTGKMSGFSPGGTARVKTIQELSQNETAHEALVAIVGAHYQTPVDYGFNVDEWILWRRNVDQLANFYPRRDR